MPLHIVANGEPHTLPGPRTVAEVVVRITGRTERTGLAVARNGDIVPKSTWDDVQVQDGDELEIAAPFQGG